MKELTLRETMPAVSIITPSHNPRYLDETALSVLAQTHSDWEWIVLLNGKATWKPPKDDRIKIVFIPKVSGVGEAKSLACKHVSGNIILELDHDDTLHPEAVAKVIKAFEKNPEASLVYSDAASIDTNGTSIKTAYGDGYGWTYKRNRGVRYPVSFEALPHNVSLIWFAPNHLRAFRRTAYEAVGGYDTSLDILDDQDLMSRLYQYGAFVQLKEVLYYQRLHDENTQKEPTLNARIQEETWVLYERYFEKNALVWAQRNNLKALDMGAAHGKPDGYLGVDMREGADIVCELPNRLPLPDNSVGVIRASDFLEHVPDKIAVINELYRVLAPGGILLSNTPSTDGRGAFQDPTHVAFYNENSFWYYTDENLRKYVPEIEARFQISRLRTLFPTEWHQQHNISYVEANLIALKPGMARNGGFIHFPEFLG
jgi:glycosyltransferase involved in cell wall biosynthesis